MLVIERKKSHAQFIFAYVFWLCKTKDRASLNCNLIRIFCLFAIKAAKI